MEGVTGTVSLSSSPGKFRFNGVTKTWTSWGTVKYWTILYTELSVGSTSPVSTYKTFGISYFTANLTEFSKNSNLDFSHLTALFQGNARCNLWWNGSAIYLIEHWMVVTYPLGGYTVTEYSRVSDHVLIEARPRGQSHWCSLFSGLNWEAGIVTPHLINGLRRRFVLWYYKKLFNLQIKSYTVLQDNRTILTEKCFWHFGGKLIRD